MTDRNRCRRWRSGRGALAPVLAVALALLASAVFIRAAPAESLEYQVKASYLYNFLRFIKWPVESFGRDGSFHLCVLGAERFGAALDAIDGENVRGRRIVVHRLGARAQDADAPCQVLFVAAELDVPPDAVRPRPGLLTIGETPGFLNRGGIINLINRDGRVRFEINQDAALAAGLVISSRLLALAVN